MKYVLGVVALGLSLFLGGCKQQVLSEQDQTSGSPASRGAMMAAYQNTDNAEQGVVLVKFKRDALPSAITRSPQGVARTGVQAVDALADELSVQQIERVFPYVERTEAYAIKHGLDLWYRVTYDPTKASLRSAVDNYSSIEQLDWVETVKRVVLTDGIATDKAIVMDPTEMAATRADDIVRTFNDPYLHRQWWFDSQNTSVQGVHAKAGINMPVAWEKYTGSSEIIIGVMDGCVKWTHEDLVDNMWVNKGEIPYNKIDDDGNGYIDDVNGYDFYAKKADDAEMSPHDHGTHVAGIIAAVNNNGKGMSSIAGGTGNKDGVRIMTCQLFKGVRGAEYDKMAEGIKYAADNGAVISQNSWGFQTVGQRSKVIEDAIDYFVAEAGNAKLFPNSPMRGGLVFFAAGNEAHIIGQQQLFPQAYDKVVSVSSTDHARKRSGFACYGDWVELTAPGGRDPLEDDTEAIKQHFIISTIAGSNFQDNKQYGYYFGTSQACPMVSGVTALLIQANPGKTNTQIKELILSSVASLEDTETDYKFMGSGLLDAGKYLFATKTADAPDPITDLALTQDAKKIYSLKWTVPTDKNGDYIADYTLYVGGSKLTEANLSGAAKKITFDQFKRLPAGQTITIDLVDSLGVNMTRSNYFAVTSSDQWGNVSLISNVVAHEMSNDGNPVGFGDGGAVAVNGLLEVNWSNDFKGEKTINVYDRSGRRVIQHKLTDADVSDYQLNVKGLASGNYTLEVVGSDSTYRRSFRKF